MYCNEGVTASVVEECSLHRLFRLRAFLEPYSPLDIVLSDTLPAPIAVEKRALRRGAPRYLVTVRGSLLASSAPPWVEEALLEEVRHGIAALQGRTAINERQAAARLTSLLPSRAKEAATTGEGLQQLWQSLRVRYFPTRDDLDSFTVRWADRRQRRVLATCNVARRRVEVAAALRDPTCSEILEPLLYHELCHAALGEVRRVNGRRQMHGREFHALERRHPQIKALNQWIKAGNWQKVVRRAARQRRAKLSGLAAPKNGR